MPVLDGDFEAFVTNLGKYNEGMLVGEWVKLPTTEEEMQKVFERIGIGKQDEFGQPYEEWFITDYECPIYGVQKMLGEYESLDKLNYLAALIDELSLSDQEKLVAIMEAGCDEVSDIDDLINLTFNLDCYDIMPGINDESDLGYYYAHEAGIYSEKDLGPLANYIDYERYGRDIAMDEQGRFTDEGYVRVASERWDRQFNGDLDDIPDEYRITGSEEAAERTVTLGRHLLRLLDTAGIRETADRVEELGVARALQAAQTCQLALFVVDGSKPLTPEDEAAMDAALQAPEAIAILNKQDLPCVMDPSELPFAYVIPVSCAKNEGLDLLEQALDMVFDFDAPCDGSILTNARQADAIAKSRESIEAALSSLRLGMTPDAVLVDVEAAMESLGEATGRVVREDITNRIFERFCVGK